ncbi:MAG: SRPBCC domain-containing protein [Melioribacteraceae bacterium]|nr:SRPBCC domain-containing protein [Melioribacteraceae bacterium]MCF8412082.1 SRPBCC domain-containing protein [Melioribacteraceae bacterium]
MREVKCDINISAETKDVLSVFTEHEHLQNWWKVDKSKIEKRAGGAYLLAWLNETGTFSYISASKIRKYEPSSILHLEDCFYFSPNTEILGPMELIFEVKESGKGKTILQVCQTSYQTGGTWDWYYESVKNAWPGALTEIKKYIEQKRN